MLVYKSWDTFNTRFDWNARGPFHLGGQSFEIESYLKHHGTKFANNAASSYDPNCYLLMSKASDLTNLQFRGKTVRCGKKKHVCFNVFSPKSIGHAVNRPGESYLESMLRIQSRMLLFGITSDIVIPLAEQTEIFNILRSAGRANLIFDVSNSPHGHDAFLLDEGYFIPRIRKFLNT